MQPPFDLGEHPTLIGGEQGLFLMRRDEPRSAALFSGDTQTWHQIASPPDYRAATPVLTDSGPVIFGGRCDGPCHDEASVSMFVARYDEERDEWSDVPLDRRIDGLDRFAEGTLAIGAVGSAIYIDEQRELWQITDDNEIEVIAEPAGLREATCVVGDHLESLVRFGSDAEFPDLADLELVERSVEAVGDWKRATESAPVSAAPAGSEFRNALCGSSGPVVSTASELVVRTGDRNWRAFDIEVEGPDHAVRSSSVVPGRGAVVEFRAQLALVGADGVQYHELPPFDALPPIRHLAAAGDRVVLMEQPGQNPSKPSSEQDHTYTLSYVDF